MNRFPYFVGLLLLSWGAIVLAQEEPKDKPKETEMPDPQKLAVEAQKAADLLKKKDTGAETQKIQQDVAKAIDDLIKQRKDPPPMMPPDMMPPPMMNMMPPPMGMMGMPPPMMGGGMMGMPPPMGGMNMGGGGMGMKGMSQPDQGGMSRKEKREQEKEKEKQKGMTGGKDPMKKEMGMTGMGMDKKDMKDMTGMGMKDKKGMEGMKDMGMMAMGNPEKGPPPKENPPRKPEKLTEMYKDLWGSLPDRARQELDVYDRERYMPRYADLLSRYFSNISEAKKKGNDK